MSRRYPVTVAESSGRPFPDCSLVFAFRLRVSGSAVGYLNPQCCGVDTGFRPAGGRSVFNRRVILRSASARSTRLGRIFPHPPSLLLALRHLGGAWPVGGFLCGQSGSGRPSVGNSYQPHDAEPRRCAGTCGLGPKAPLVHDAHPGVPCGCDLQGMVKQKP